MLLLVLLFSFFVYGNNNLCKEIIVLKTGKIKSISNALSIAEEGDIIKIKPGLYEEPRLTIEKRISLIVEGEVKKTSNGGADKLLLKKDGIVVEKLTIKGASFSHLRENAAIKIENCSGVIVRNTKLLNNYFGIYLAASANCIIENNFISGLKRDEINSGNGIHLWYCREMKISGNRILNHRDGIYLEFSKQVFIEENSSRANIRYGLHFMFSDSCRYIQNTFTDNGAGVAVMYSANVLMEKNLFEFNRGTAAYGVLLKEIRDSKIISNSFNQNTIGLYLEATNRVEVENNQFSGNGWALKVMANSMDNVFCKNNFIGNSFDISTNSRQNYNRFELNYWDKYKSYDLNKDGIGDIPYRPVNLFSLITAQNPPALILLRSFFIDVLNFAESIFPALTPESLIDTKPKMRKIE
jgi:nitrous oxidase accessory protein